MNKRVTFKKIVEDNGKEVDYQVLNKYLALLLHLDCSITNLLSELSRYLKTSGFMRQEIKKNINVIKEKLKTNPKNDWNKISEDDSDRFVADNEIFEDMCKRFIGLSKTKSICVTPEYFIGEKVWVLDNNKNPRLAHILDIQIQMTIDNDSKLIDNSYYNLRLCDKNDKLTKYTIQRGESEIYKHKKDIYDSNN